MILGPMSDEPFEGSPAPENDALDRESQDTGRRLAEALQEIRERALKVIEELESGSPRQPDDASSGEPNVTTQEIEDLLDDDLGLKEKIDKCSDLRASLLRQWSAAHRTPSLAEVKA